MDYKVDCSHLIQDLSYIADNEEQEINLKAALVSLNILESDLIQLGLFDNAAQDILEIRLKINDRLGWLLTH